MYVLCGVKEAISPLPQPPSKRRSHPLLLPPTRPAPAVPLIASSLLLTPQPSSSLVPPPPPTSSDSRLTPSPSTMVQTSQATPGFPRALSGSALATLSTATAASLPPTPVPPTLPSALPVTPQLLPASQPHSSSSQGRAGCPPPGTTQLKGNNCSRLCFYPVTCYGKSKGFVSCGRWQLSGKSKALADDQKTLQGWSCCNMPT